MICSGVNKAYAMLLGTVVPDVIASQLEITLPQKAGTKSLKDLAAIAMAEGRAQTASSHVIAGGKRRWV